jgi:predicted phage terminase large subunit-like protein
MKVMLATTRATKTMPRSPGQELLHRQRVRSSMAELSKLCELTPAAHHLYLMRHLEQVTRGEISRLLISAPPGAAKSQTTSVFFPVHYLANHPDAQIILCSHTTELAERFGRRVRNLIGEHSSVLGLQLSDDSQAAGRWSLKSGGSLFACGATSALAGHRADLLIQDDVYRSQADAYSEVVRKSISEWFFSEALPRLRPGARVVGIGTRFHHADLLAQLEETGRYKTIKLTAIAEEGDELGRPVGAYLWDDQPDPYPYASFLKHQQEVQPPRVWASLFMCRPTPQEGSFFRSEWLKTYHHAPPRDELKTYIAVDFATSVDKGDYTAIVAFGVDPAGDIFVLDVFRRQVSPDVSISALLDMVRDWRPMVIVTEAGGLKNALGPFLKEQMNLRRIWCAVEVIPSKHNKEVRAQSIAGRMAVRGLFIPASAPWVADLVTEVLAFPAGKNDDQVDCLSLLGQLLSQLIHGSAPEPTEQPKVLSTDPALCTVRLADLFEANERRGKYRRGGIERI